RELLRYPAVLLFCLLSSAPVPLQSFCVSEHIRSEISPELLLIYLPFLTSSLSKQLIYRFAAKFCYFFRSLQLTQTCDCSQYNVLFVSGAQRFGTDVLDTCKLDHGTGRTACDDTGTFRSSLQQNLCASEFTYIVMCDTSCLINGYVYQFLHGVFFTFADSFRNFGCFSKSGAYVS